MEPQHVESLYPATTRERELGELFGFIKSGKSAQLIALPGVGRANVLGFLAYNRNIRIHHVGEKEQANYHFVLCNFSEIKNRPLFDVVKFLFLELASSLHERRREEEFLLIDKMFKDALSYNDELVLFQAFKDAIELLTLEKGFIVTLLFERFETYIPQVTEQFFNSLRSVRNRAKYKFSVVFSLTRPLDDAVEPELLADFYEHIAENHVFLSLHDSEGLQFRISHLEKLTGKKIPKKTIDDILALTAGHGKLTRLAMEAFLAKDTQMITPNWLMNLKTIQGALREIWEFLTPDEKQDMLTLCKGEECPLPNQFLQHVGLIRQQKIAIPLFALYVQQQKAQEKPTFEFDLATNTIKRAGSVISDQLTLSEFRLLRLLLEKEGNVIDREEVIATVWSDSKTQIGVSEQAVDQLIFRLRKKVEDDPSNPAHIQTVKGRGIKFVQ